MRFGRDITDSCPDGVAKMVINDFLRGKIPWYTPPPAAEGEDADILKGREGRLGEMSRKRKRTDADTTLAENAGGDATTESVSEEEEDRFSGFDDGEVEPPSDDESDEEEGGAEIPQETLDVSEDEEVDESSEAEDDLPLQASNQDRAKDETESDLGGRRQATATKGAKRRRKA